MHPSSKGRSHKAVEHHAVDATRTAAEALNITASMTRDVPFVGIVSGVLNEVIKIHDEVESYKAARKSTIHVARQVKTLIVDVHQRTSGLGGIGLPEDVEQACLKLERSVDVAIARLEQCKALSINLWDRACIVVNRKVLADAVKLCRTKIQDALGLFIVALQIYQTRAILEIVMILRDQQIAKQRTLIQKISHCAGIKVKVEKKCIMT
ncbi:hypothetical protein PENSPDRAFT_60268 [Peniophora sp. CONT]|nr:hypothetical protein PENSPDRAFT_60268 [Peniophora sp. CONT]